MAEQSTIFQNNRIDQVVVNQVPERPQSYENDDYEDVNMKIRGQGKEQLRQWASAHNMGMSTALNKGWELLQAFENDYECLLAHPDAFKEFAKIVRKNF